MRAAQTAAALWPQALYRAGGEGGILPSMGELRRISSDLRRLRGPRVFAAGAVVLAAVAGAVGCRPVDGDLNPSTVAATTDQEATRELNRQHAKVAWLSCSGSYDSRAKAARSSPSEVTVDCRGKAKGGKDATLKGWIYGVVPGKCVRGDVIARIDGKVWFHLQVLGNCAPPSGTGPRHHAHRDRDRHRPRARPQLLLLPREMTGPEVTGPEAAGPEGAGPQAAKTEFGGGLTRGAPQI
jgi:hypothetical protein